MKRISRRELKEKIKTLKRRVEVLESEVKEAETEKRRFAKRLEYLGREEWKQLDLSHIEIKPETYGSYAYIIGDEIEPVKSFLVEKLVKGLIKAGYVQFIVRNERSGPLDFGKSVGAKLFVVPWDKTVIGRARYERQTIAKIGIEED